MEEAILRTLVYADIFDYPLRLEEIRRFLIGQHANDSQLKANLSKLANGGKINSDGEFHFLKGRDDLVKIRKKRQVWSEKKLKKAKSIALILRIIPWIKMVAVTGALAIGNSNEDDDIDLMIITAKNRLWLTRGLLVTFLRLTNQYRRPQKIKDRICPNLMLSEDNLEFPEKNLFTAHEAVQMKVLWEREGLYQRFLGANLWVGKYLPNAMEAK